MSSIGKIKRGSILKGKIKVFSKIIIALFAVLTAVVLVAFAFKDKGAKGYAEFIKNGNDYSGFTEQGMILSVEKVGVSAQDVQNYVDNSGTSFKTPLYSTPLAPGEEEEQKKNKEIEKMLVPGGAYYYKNLTNQLASAGNSEKYVVNNGEFVMLNNRLSNGQYINDQISDAYTEEGPAVKMSEAILITFGGYFRYTDVTGNTKFGKAGQVNDMQGSIDAQNSGANMENLIVNITKDGQPLEMTNVIRTYNTYYQDFGLIIPQFQDGEQSTEGHYVLNFSYRYDGNPSSNNVFEFNLLFRSSYHATESVGEDQYTAEPTISKATRVINESNNQFEYFLGKQADYPVLVYDYTKYHMSFTHTANGVATTCEYTATINSTGELSATLTADIPNQTDDEPISYNMSKFTRGRNNFVVFVFTEMGSYDFHFTYLYETIGENGAINLTSSGMNLQVDDLSLSIYGHELKYSPVGYREAELRKITLSGKQGEAGENQRADLIVPGDIEYINAHRTTQLNELGPKFEYRNDSTAMVGSVIEMLDANIQTQSEEYLTSGEGITSKDDDIIEFVREINEIKDQATIDAATEQKVADWLNNKIDFVKTNQPNIWLETNNAINRDASFYYTSTNKNNLLTKPSQDGGSRVPQEQQKYINTTTFSTAGYYLVFIYNDVSNENDYYQVFAFEYSDEVIVPNIVEQSTEEYEGKVIGSRGFTNKNVEIYWQKPGVFEKQVQGKYYYMLDRYINNEITLDYIVSHGIQQNLTSGDKNIVGNEVPEGHGATFVVKIEGDGQSYRIFTIDRQPISGVGLYEVRTNPATFGGVYYTVSTDTNGQYVQLTNVITNSLATLNWNDKNSGAKITAQYTYTPFTKYTPTADDNSKKIKMVENTPSNELWFTTNYQLGQTSSIFEDITKPTALNDILSDENLIKNQGIYLFTLTDDAGNQTKFMFVVDDTESYFYVYEDGKEGEGKYLTASSEMYASSTKVRVSTHKAINLFSSTDVSTDIDETADDKNRQDLLKIISNLSSDVELNSLNYYTDAGHRSNIRNLFDSTGQGTLDYYLKVRNRSLTTYDNLDNYKGENSIGEISRINNSITIEHNEEDGTSTVRFLYIIGENQISAGINLDPSNTSYIRNSRSYLLIEINTDNSRGFVYYGNTDFTSNQIPADGKSSSDVIRLYTGNSLNNLEATSDNHIAFVWNTSNNGFTVESITYSYYTLDVTNYSEQTAFYTLSEEDVVLYQSGGGYEKGAYTFDNGNRAFAPIRKIGRQTQEGLYIITRTYTEGGNFEKDDREKHYWFIVDRNGIKTSGISGDRISTNLLKDETTFNSFGLVGTELGSVNFVEGKELVGPIDYNVYFTTNKLPATLSIPNNKYYQYGTGATPNVSNYAMGLLNVKVVFKDTAYQLQNIPGFAASSNLLIYSGNAEVKIDAQNNQYFNVDFYDYLSNYSDVRVRDRFVNSGNNHDWICLPGDYVVIISDNVRSIEYPNGGSHQMVFGFRVSPNAPAANLGAISEKVSGGELTFSEGDKPTLNADGSYSLTTNKEYIAVELPEYVVVENYSYENRQNALYAQLDVEYLVVKKNGGYYFNYNHGDLGEATHDLNNDPDVENNRSGQNIVSRKIYLNTDLRKADGSINLDNISTPINFEITVRFKLYNARSSGYEEFLNSYYSYDENGNLRDYYYATYNITIDRQAPINNTNYLEQNDALVSYYNEENGTNKMIMPYANDNPVYFANRYESYYSSNKNQAKIYPFKVSSSTHFDLTDVERIFYRAYTSNLNLPVVPDAEPTWHEYNQRADDLTYGDIIGEYRRDPNFNIENITYVEMLEIDKAGNATQYVVFFDDGSNSYDDLNLVFNVRTLNNKLFENDNFTINLSENRTQDLSIFNISVPQDLDDEEAVYGSYIDKFYHYELLNLATNTRVSKNTNLTTQFTKSGIILDIVNLIKDSGEGNYRLTLMSRTHTVTINLNYYNEATFDETLTQLDPGALVEGVGENTQINLTKAKKEIIEGSGVYNYATTIIIRLNGALYDEYTCNPNDNYSYTNRQGDKVEIISHLDVNGNYQIEMIDVMGARKTYYEFNISHEPYSISFGLDGSANYYKDPNGSDPYYYSFNQANISYNSDYYLATITYSIQSEGVSHIISGSSAGGNAGGIKVVDITTENGFTIIKLIPYLNGNSQGDLLTAEINIYREDNTFSYTYLVRVDNRLGEVWLRNGKGENCDYRVDINADHTQTERPTNTYSGTSTLSWEVSESNQFDYVYTLYEQLDTDEIVATNLNGRQNYIIDTRENSKGIYRFVVDVYAKGILDLNNITEQEKSIYYLGNKVYTFVVTAKSDQLYYVRTENFVVMDANSTFKWSELFAADSGLNLRQDEKDAILNWFHLGDDYNIIENKMFPLYISNENLEVVVEPDLNATKLAYPAIVNGNYSLVLYKISTPNYNYYIATLKAPVTNNLVENFQLVSSSTTRTLENNTNYTFAGSAQESFSLNATQIRYSSLFEKKNTILMYVYYNDTFVKMVEFNTDKINFDILGNGRYSFVFKDLAGNTHYFGQGGSTLYLTILREVVVFVNGEAPIEYAYYNDKVELSIYNPGMYLQSTESAPINVTATRNGQVYTPEIASSKYTFSDYGTYRVTVTATYVDSNGQSYPLTKVFSFTILNNGEARQSIDLTSLNGYELIKATNNLNEDITDVLMGILNLNNSSEGMLLTYDKLLENSATLNITAGKQTFTLTYRAKADIYPERTFTFAFVMNNEVPTIECSLAPGDSNNKGFSLTFNPAIIYEQVGESAVYLNNTLLATIDKDVADSVVSFYISQKEYGSGDYYISLRTKSGDIISQYMVTLTEPLNVWAIIIIVVVVAVVITVVTIIIVLRTRMKIR